MLATAANAADSISILALLADRSPARRPRVADSPETEDLPPLSSMSGSRERTLSGDAGADVNRFRDPSGCAGIDDVAGGVSARRSSDGDSEVGNLSRSVSEPDRDKSDKEPERSLRKLLEARDDADWVVDGTGDRDKRLALGGDGVDRREMEASLSSTWKTTRV